MNRGQTKKLARQLLPGFEKSDQSKVRTTVMLRDQKSWDRVILECSLPVNKDLFIEQVDARSSEANTARRSAIELCKMCVVRESCFEQALLNGAVGVVYAGVPSSTLSGISNAIGRTTRNHVGSLHPDHPDRQDFFEASNLLLKAIDGDISPSKAVELRSANPLI